MASRTFLLALLAACIGGSVYGLLLGVPLLSTFELRQ
jgi:hypothetical protein